MFTLPCVLVSAGAYYIVAPSEADMQEAGRLKPSVVATYDGDLIAYGNKKVFIINSYSNERFHFIDLDIPLTDELEQKYPLYAAYRHTTESKSFTIGQQ